MKGRVIFFILLVGVLVTTEMLIYRQNVLGTEAQPVKAVAISADVKRELPMLESTNAMLINNDASISSPRTIGNVTWAAVYKDYPALERIHHKYALRSIESRLTATQEYLGLDDKKLQAYRDIIVESYIELKTLPEKGDEGDADSMQQRAATINSVLAEKNEKIRALIGEEQYEKLSGLASFTARQKEIYEGLNVDLFEAGLPLIKRDTAAVIARAIQGASGGDQHSPESEVGGNGSVMSDSQLAAVLASLSNQLNPQQSHKLLEFLRRGNGT
jgi:hypothetical protein